MSKYNFNVFTNRLPFDVVTEIFSEVEQDDCLVCMKVCREWHEQVPQYSKKKWEKIQLWQKEEYDRINAMMRFPTFNYNEKLELLPKCLGKHVTTIEFNGFNKERELYKMMRMLIDWDCVQVKSLVFLQCTTVNENSFSNLLRPLASELTDLVLKLHKAQNSVSFLYQILQLCPKLRCISFISNPRFGINFRSQLVPGPNDGDDNNGSGSDNDSVDEISVSSVAEEQQQLQTSLSKGVCNIANNDAHVFDNLIYIQVDGSVHKGELFKRILQKCPNLRHFIQQQWYRNNSRISDIPEIHLDQLVSYCPKLISFTSNGSDDYDYGPEVVLKQNLLFDDDKDDQSSDKKKGFRNLSVNGDQKKDYIFQQLRNSQNTLEYMKLMYDRPDHSAQPHRGNNWSTEFRTLEIMSHLRTLVLEGLRYDTNAFIALLNKCTSLETLVLRNSLQDFEDQTLKQLRPLSTLRTLHLQYFSFSRNEIGFGRALTSMLERLPNLDNLIISDDPFATLRPLKEINVELLMNLKLFELNCSVYTEEGEENDSEILQTLFQQMAVTCNNGESEHPLSAMTAKKRPQHETIRIINVPNITSEVLLSASQFSMLKVIEFKQNKASWLLLDHHSDYDDVMLCVVNNLVECGAPVEELVFCPVKLLSHDTLEALSKLQRLERLDMSGSGRFLKRHRSSPRELLSIDTQGLCLLLSNSPKLATLYFSFAHLQQLRKHKIQKSIGSCLSAKCKSVVDRVTCVLKQFDLSHQFYVTSPYPNIPQSSGPQNTTFTISRRLIHFP